MGWGKGKGKGWLGALGFAAAALHLQARDRWIGWDYEGRQAHLDRVVGSSRFLIRPSVQCRNLASRVLGLAMARLPEDFAPTVGGDVPPLPADRPPPIAPPPRPQERPAWLHDGACRAVSTVRTGLAGGSVSRVSNLMVACGVHHRAIHQGALHVERSADGALTTRWPAFELPTVKTWGLALEVMSAHPLHTSEVYRLIDHTRWRRASRRR